MNNLESDGFAGKLGKLGCDAPGFAGTLTSPEQRRVLCERARQIRYSRDLREKLFDRNIFGEPAWDILLALYTINDERRLSIRELCELADVALTTALRWLDSLEEQGMVDRVPNRFDQRMVCIALADKGRAAMDSYLSQMRGSVLFRPIVNAKLGQERPLPAQSEPSVRPIDD